MTKPDLMTELAEVVRLKKRATAGKWIGYRAQKFVHLKTAVGDYLMEANRRGDVRNPPDADYIAALHNWLDTHHAELEAAVRKAKQFDLMTSRLYDETGKAMHNSAREGS